MSLTSYQAAPPRRMDVARPPRWRQGCWIAPNPRSGVGGVPPRSKNMRRLRHLWDSRRGRGAAGGGALPRFATERMFLKHGRGKGRARPPAEPSDPSGEESGISIRPTRPVLHDDEGSSLKMERFRGFGMAPDVRARPARASSSRRRARRCADRRSAQRPFWRIRSEKRSKSARESCGPGAASG